MVDTTALHAQVARLGTIKAGIEALFAAQAKTISDAVSKAIADTMATDAATAADVQAAAQTAIDTETAGLASESDGLAADVVANTSVAPPPPPPTA